MRLFTVLVSSVLVHVGVSIPIPVERENSFLVARFAEPHFFTDVEVRAYGKDPQLYTRGGGLSKLSLGHHKPPSYQEAMREPPHYQRTPPDPTHLIPYQTDGNIPPPSYKNAKKDPIVMPVTELDGRPLSPQLDRPIRANRSNLRPSIAWHYLVPLNPGIG